MSLQTQSAFAWALQKRAAAVPEGLRAWNGPCAERRFGVYRNNVFWGLAEALRSRFPVTAKIVGDAFFTAMADAFVQAHPPQSPLLLTYGDKFPAFAERFPPTGQLPYLSDVMRLEIARSYAYHAFDRLPLNPAELARIAPEHLGGCVFEPHPSLSILRSAHPVVTIWAMNSGELTLSPIELWQGEDALVVRPGMIVNVHRLLPGGAVFIAELQSGQTLCQAVMVAMESEPDFDLGANLAALLQTGSFTTIRSQS